MARVVREVDALRSRGRRSRSSAAYAPTSSLTIATSVAAKDASTFAFVPQLASASAQLRRDRKRARDAGDQRTRRDDRRREQQRVVRCPRAGSSAAPSRQPSVITDMRCGFASGPRKSCGSPQDPPSTRMYAVTAAASAPSQPSHGSAGRVAERDDEQGIGDAIGNFVVEHADGDLLAALDRDHAVEQVAEQAQLDARGRRERVRRCSAESTAAHTRRARRRRC